MPDLFLENVEKRFLRNHPACPTPSDALYRPGPTNLVIVGVQVKRTVQILIKREQEPKGFTMQKWVSPCHVCAQLAAKESERLGTVSCCYHGL